jgi:alanyl-tRNA synthetase
MDSKTTRKQFIEYFEKTLGHTVVPSAPVVPQADPTLLFTNAGMNQFKPYFLGEAQAPFKRAVNSQKCIRVSGKHNDLEAVGRDHYHHTFFEMLGSWSFGDYYKKEAIEWAWTLFTDIWGLDPKRLYATVFTDDDEAYNIWHKIPDLPEGHLLRSGEKDNFWSMGDTGPCGPCSEIHYYSGENVDEQDPARVNADDPEYMELWNLVFIQYDRDDKGELHPLTQKHIDTGAGFERIVAVLNGYKSNYDTDLFKPIIEQIEAISDIAYDPGDAGTPHRVIADHIRMLSVAISDGAIPGNEGRSYVLRRILRRAARFGRELRMKEPFLYRLVPTVSKVLGDVYPEIKHQREQIQKIIRAEEESFGNTLDKGLELFGQIAKQARKNDGKTLNSEDVFRLYDTYGFPVDLTKLLAKEKGLSVNEDEVNTLMEQQRERARAAGKFTGKNAEELNWIILDNDKTPEFAGYDTLSCDAQLVKYAVDDNFTYLVFDKTPFYAESGGQVGDKGQMLLQKHSGIKTDARTNIIDTKKMGEDIVHVVEGSVLEGDSKQIKATLEVQESLRRDTARNHTATHLLHAELRSTLGEHVHQAGSYVGPDRLRFDFTHFEKVPYELQMEIQQRVNTVIMQNIEVKTEIKPYAEAINEGAQALFGEKYGDEVRVVSVRGASKELCGGTHVRRSGDIGLFMIVSESSVASGVRRIEAVTGKAAYDVLKKQHRTITEIKDVLKAPEKDLAEKVNEMTLTIRHLEKDVIELKSKMLTLDVDAYLKEPRDINGNTYYINKVNVENMDQLKALGDKVREKMSSGVAVFGTIIKETPQILCVVTDDLVKSGIKAGNIVKILGKALGGGGGGKPHMATAGGKDTEKLDEILRQADILLKE